MRFPSSAAVVVFALSAASFIGASPSAETLMTTTTTSSSSPPPLLTSTTSAASSTSSSSQPKVYSSSTFSASDCVYVAAEEETQYNLNGLASAPYFEWAEASQTYRFSFCKYVEGFTCGSTNDPTSTFLVGIGTSCAQSFGKVMNATWRPIFEDPTAGLALTYSGGSTPCNAFGMSRYTTFNIACDNTIQAPYGLFIDSLSVSADKCGLTYNIRSPSGCGFPQTKVIRTLGVGWVIFVVLISVISLYLLGGVLYKRHKYGSSGIESIPNIDSWRVVGRYLYGGGMVILGVLTCNSLGNRGGIGGSGGGGFTGLGSVNGGGNNDDDVYHLTSDEDGNTVL